MGTGPWLGNGEYPLDFLLDDMGRTGVPVAGRSANDLRATGVRASRRGRQCFHREWSARHAVDKQTDNCSEPR